MKSTEKAKGKRLQFRSPQEAGLYFDAHSADEFWGQTRSVELEGVEGKVLLSIEITGALGKKLTSQAHRRNIPISELVTHSLSEALD